MSRVSRYNLLLQRATKWLVPKTFSISGEKSSKNDFILRECFTAWLFLIEDLHYSSDEIQRDKIEFEWMLAVNSASDITIFSKCCKDIYDMLISSLSGKRTIIYRDFKDHIKSLSQHRGILTPIRRQLKLLLRQQSFYISGELDYESKQLFKEALRCVAQYLHFSTKLVVANPLLEEQAIVDYMAVEEENKIIQLQGYDDAIVNSMTQILNEWLADFHVDINLMQHGNGSTADAKYPCLLTKYMKMCTDPKINLLLRSYEIGKPSYLDDFAPLGLQTEPLTRTSSLIFVPKNCTKLRSISMEPTVLQFAQQGVMRSLGKWFKCHPYLKTIIRLDDQSQNRFLAYFGSYNDSLSTIDLSHASDSVVWDLVKKLFRGNSELYKWLLGTRSDSTMLPDGTIVRLTKYAPMGSALCFPIETLVFAAAVETIARQKRREGLNTHYDLLKTKSMPPYSVYGDDIIVPREWFNDVVSILNNLGFSVNDSKSYESGFFKESCGINCFDATDITPIKFNPKWDNTCKKRSNGMSPEAYTAFVSYANQAHNYGYKMLRSYCINRIKAAGIKPFFTHDIDDTSGILSDVPVSNLNYHLVGKDFGRCSTVSTKIDNTLCQKITSMYFNDCKEDYDAALVKVHYHVYLRKPQSSLVGANMIMAEKRIATSYINSLPIWLIDPLRIGPPPGSTIIYPGLKVWEGYYSLEYDTSVISNSISCENIRDQFSGKSPSYKTLTPSVVKIGRKTVIKDRRCNVVTEDRFALGLIQTIMA